MEIKKQLLVRINHLLTINVRTRIMLLSCIDTVKKFS